MHQFPSRDEESQRLPRRALPDEAVLSRVFLTLDADPSGMLIRFDGVLSPLAAKPEQARLTAGAAEALRRLAGSLAMVAIVSGRSLDDLRRLVAVPDLIYLGNHGLETCRRDQTDLQELSPKTEQQLFFARHVLHLTLTRAPGLLLEDKGHSLALHYGHSPHPDHSRALALSLAEKFASAELEVVEGWRSVEVRPARAGAGTIERLVAEFRLCGLLVIEQGLLAASPLALQASGGPGCTVETLTVGAGEANDADTERSANRHVESPAALVALLQQLAQHLRALPAQRADRLSYPPTPGTDQPVSGYRSNGRDAG